jgi:signal transduction histidine kinase/ActR/RegA family two-component response regulator
MHFVLNEAGEFLRLGPVLKRICPEVLGSRLLEHFTVHRPRKFELSKVKLQRKGKPELVAILHREGKVALRGQAEVVGDELVFLMNPWTSARDGHGTGVNLVDYAWHDGGADSATVLFTQRTAMEESRLAISELTAQKEELEQAREDAEAARQCAEEAQEAQARFLAMMSHELRTPLNGILGLVEVMDMLGMSDELRELLGVVQGSGRMLMSIVDGVLDYSLIASGKLDLDPVACDLKTLVSGVAALHRPVAGFKGLSLTLDLPPEPLWVLIDDNRLQQALGNLLGNAMKFTESGGVTLGLRQHADGSYVFFVQDTGIGMTADQCTHLFEPFEQASGGATARRFGGTGLGLSITAGIVEAMQGRITIDSTPGEGTTFSITLSLEETQPSVESQSVRPTGADGLSVLVVDDNPVNRNVAERQLAFLGATTHVAESGPVALDIMAREDLDLVLMDLEMPEMNGYETHAEMQRLGISLPVIALTAHALVEFRERSEEAGMQGFLSKPTSLRGLSEAIGRVLQVELPSAS